MRTIKPGPITLLRECSLRPRAIWYWSCWRVR